MRWRLRALRRLRPPIGRARAERGPGDETRSSLGAAALTARDRRPWRPVAEVVADARYGLRGLRRNPGFALTAILTLALGIGAASAVFGALRAVVLAPLPYPAPEQLVRIFQQNSPDNRWTISNADWQGIRDHQRSFQAVALLRGGGGALSTGGEAEWVSIGAVTADFFRVLGVRFVRGPGFRAGDDVPGAPRTVVISERLAERHFGAVDPIGRALVLDRTGHTVVGVIAGGSREHAGVRAEVWPILQLPTPTRRGPFGYVGIGRLRDGVTLDAAARDLAVVSDRIFPSWAASFPDRTARLTPYALHEVIVGDADRSLGVLALAVTLVLLVAVANVANLVLVRAVGRRREMAVRTALGARRSRLAGLLLTESLVLGVLGGAAGVLVAVLGLEALRVVGPDLPRLDDARLDWRAMALTFAAAVGSGLLVGTYPLVAATRGTLVSSMRAGDLRAGASRGTQLFQGALVALEFALALPLLLGAGLLLHSFVRLQGVDPGVDTRNVITASLTLPSAAYPDPEAMQRYWDEALRRVGAVPGVTAVGLATSLPPDNGGDSNNFDLLDRPVPAGTAEPVAPWSWVTPGAFAALGVPLLEGRLTRETDGGDAPPVIVVSRAWAERWFPGESAIGRRLWAGGCRECEPSTVVGVVGDVKYAGLAGGGEAVYEPSRGGPWRTQNLVVRTAGAPAAMIGAVRAQLRALDPDVPLRDVATMEERLAGSIAQPRRLTGLVVTFAAVAAALAAVGIFGVMSYAVAQQRREIGVRLALGTQPGAVVGMVVRRGMSRAAIGLALGALLALPGLRLLRTVLFEVRVGDPLTVAAASLLLLAVALAACWLPARRASRIPPTDAMAAE